MNGSPSNTLVGGTAWYGNQPTPPPAAPANFGSGMATQAGVYDPSNNALYFSGLRGEAVGVLNASTLAPITLIPVADGPVAMALDEPAQRLFVADYWNDSVTVINCSDERVLATVELGSNPEFVALGPHDQNAYVPNGNGVSVINATTFRLGTPIRGPSNDGLYSGGAYDPQDGLLYVTNTSDGIAPINVSTDTWAGGNISISSDGQFGSLWFDPISTALYLSDNLSNDVWIVNVSGAVPNVTSDPVGASPMGLGWDPMTQTVFVPHMFGPNVTLLNASTGSVTGSVQSGAAPLSLGTSVAVYDPAVDRMALFSDVSNLLALIDPTNLTVSSVIDLNPQFSRSAAVPGTPWVVLADPGGSSLYLYNATDQQYLPQRVPVGPNVQDLLFDPTSRAVFAARPPVFSAIAQVGNISGTFIGNWTPTGPPTIVGPGPDALALGPNGTVVVTNCESGTVEALSALGAALPNASVVLGGCPDDVAVDPATGLAYVTDAATNSVSVLNLTTYRTEGAPWPLGNSPSAIAFDPTTEDLYIGYSDSGNLTVLGRTGALLASLPSAPGNTTRSLACDPVTGLVYAADASGVRVVYNITEIADVVIQGSLGDDANGYGVAPGTSGATVYVTSGLPGIDWLSSAPEVAPLQVSPSTVLAGRTIDLSTSPLGADLSLHYAYSGLPPGCGTVDLPSFQCRPATDGTYSLVVNATDAFGNWVRSSTTLTVASANLSGVSLTVSSPVVDVDQVVTLSSQVHGEGPSEQFAYAGLPSGCSVPNASVVHCRPTVAGAFLVSVSVNDSWGQQANASAVLEVFAPPQIVGFSALPATVRVGSTVDFVLEVTGGAPGAPLVSGTGLPPGCGEPSGELWTCIPDQVGTYNVTATVADSTGASISARATVTVEPAVATPPPPSILTAFAAPAEVALGQSVTLAVVVQGGATPLAYVFTGLPPGCRSSNFSVLTCTPSASGSYDVNVTVTDELGRSQSSTIALGVEPAVAPSPPGSTPPAALPLSLLELLAVSLAAGAAAGAGAAVLALRARRDREPGAAGPDHPPPS